MVDSLSDMVAQRNLAFKDEVSQKLATELMAMLGNWKKYGKRKFLGGLLVFCTSRVVLAEKKSQLSGSESNRNSKMQLKWWIARNTVAARKAFHFSVAIR